MTDYFIPDIEDIRVGYECEISVPYFVSKPYIVNNDNLKYKWVNHKFELQEVYGADNCLNIDYEIRTPYLTKEQIEAEGWVEIHAGFFKKGDFLMSNITNFNGIIIRKGSWYPEETKYSGECKDINTFRYICKLLKIN